METPAHGPLLCAIFVDSSNPVSNGILFGD